jgi:hypothetical protein
MSGIRLTLSLLLLLALTACQDLPPKELDPVELDPLPETRLGGTLAVVTLQDARPTFECGLRRLNHYLDLEEINPRSRYWAFHEGLYGNLSDPSSDRALTGQRARFTGEESFEWVPFPWAGTEAPKKMEIRNGLSDYLASVLDRRHIAERVIRTTDEKPQADVKYVLTGSIDHFVGILAELVPPPDRELYPGFDILVQGQAAMHLKILDNATRAVVWEGVFDSRTQMIEMSEKLKYYNPTNFWRFDTIFTDHFDYWAWDSITIHAERALKAAMQDALKDLEATLAPPPEQVPLPETLVEQPAAPTDEVTGPPPPDDSGPPPPDDKR